MKLKLLESFPSSETGIYLNNSISFDGCCDRHGGVLQLFFHVLSMRKFLRIRHNGKCIWSSLGSSSWGNNLSGVPAGTDDKEASSHFSLHDFLFIDLTIATVAPDSFGQLNCIIMC